MITEKGSLFVGIEHGGKVHKDFVLKPQRVGDSIAVLEGPLAARAAKSDAFFGMVLLCRQIEKLGDIPQKDITPELLMNLVEVDFQEINQAREALDKRLRSFRDKTKKSEEAPAGAA